MQQREHSEPPDGDSGGDPDVPNDREGEPPGSEHRGVGPAAGDGPGSLGFVSHARGRVVPRDGMTQVQDLIAAPAAPRALGEHWRQYFEGADERRLLDLLIERDPLDLWERCRGVLARRAHVVHLDRLFLEAAARTALLGSLYRGRPGLDLWLETRVLDALRGTLAADAVAEIDGRPSQLKDWWQHAMFVEVFGVPRALSRRAAVVFNSLPPRSRRILYALTFQGRSVEAAAAEGLGTRAEVERELRSGLAVLSRLDRPSLRDLLALEAEL